MNEPAGMPRRRFLGYVIAAPTLVAGAQLGLECSAAAGARGRALAAGAVRPVRPERPPHGRRARPTANLISVAVNPDGTASFALPRAEVGQGITTAVAMMIAEELDLPLDKVQGDARRRPAGAAC